MGSEFNTGHPALFPPNFFSLSNHIFYSSGTRSTQNPPRTFFWIFLYLRRVSGLHPSQLPLPSSIPRPFVALGESTNPLKSLCGSFPPLLCFSLFFHAAVCPWRSAILPLLALSVCFLIRIFPPRNSSRPRRWTHLPRSKERCSFGAQSLPRSSHTFFPLFYSFPFSLPRVPEVSSSSFSSARVRCRSLPAHPHVFVPFPCCFFSIHICVFPFFKEPSFLFCFPAQLALLKSSYANEIVPFLSL